MIEYFIQRNFYFSYHNKAGFLSKIIITGKLWHSSVYSELHKVQQQKLTHQNCIYQ